MKQKKVKFTILGIFIFVAIAFGWMVFKVLVGDAVWIAWMSEILGLITVFTVANSKDKKARIDEQKGKD